MTEKRTVVSKTKPAGSKPAKIKTAATAAQPAKSKAVSTAKKTLGRVVLAGSVVVINDDPKDGMPLFSPFTGLGVSEESDPKKDPSFVYEYLGETGEFSYVRRDVTKLVDKAMDDTFDADDESGADAVDAVAKAASTMSQKLADVGIHTLTFVLSGGWNGVVVVCYQVGSMCDGEWTPLVGK